MPIFEYNGNKVNVNDDQVSEFAKYHPDAITRIERDGKVYGVRPGDMDAFNARFTNNQEGEQASQIYYQPQATENVANKDTGSFLGDAYERIKAGAMDFLSKNQELLGKAAGTYNDAVNFSKGIKTNTASNNPMLDWSEANKRKAEELREASDRYNGKGFFDLAKNGEWGKAAGSAMLSGFESLPQSAAIMAATPFGLGGAMLADMGITSAMDRYKQLSNPSDGTPEWQKEQFKNMPEWKKIVDAGLYGVAEAGSEYLGNAATYRMIANAFKFGGKQAALDTAKKGFIDTMGKFMDKTWFISPAVVEGLEEVGNTYAQYATDKALGLDWTKGGDNEAGAVFKQAVDAFAGGFAGGTQFTAMAVPGHIKQWNDIRKVTNAYSDASKGIEGIFNEQEKAQFDETIHRFQQNGNINDINMFLFNVYSAKGLSEDQRKAVLDYTNASMSYNNYVSYVNDRINDEVKRRMEDIDSNINEDMGTVMQAVVNGDTENPVFVTKGKLYSGGLDDNMNPTIDYDKSDDVIYYRDKDGKIQQCDVKNVSYIENEKTRANLYAEIMDEVRGQVISEEENDINFAPGDEVVLPDGNTGTIQSKMEDGSYTVVSNGMTNQYTADQLVKPNEQAESEPEITSEERAATRADYPTKNGKIDFDNINDPQMFHDGLLMEFGDDAESSVDEFIANLDKELKNAGNMKDPIKKRRKIAEINRKLDFFNQVKSQFQPKENTTATVESAEAPVEQAMGDITEQPVETNDVQPEQSVAKTENSSSEKPVSATPYEDRPVDDTIYDLLDGQMDIDEVNQFVEANKKASDKALKEIEGKKPQVGTDRAEYLRQKSVWQALMDDAKRKSDYWTEVKNGLDKGSITEAEQNTLNAYDKQVPLNAHELAARALANGSIKLLREDYQKETGGGNAEANKMFGIFASEQKGGVGIERAGEILTQMDHEAGTNFLDPDDPNAARDVIIDVLSQARTRGDLINYIRDQRQAQQRREEEAAYNDFAKYTTEAYGMTPEEYQAYEDDFMRNVSSFDTEVSAEVDGMIYDGIKQEIDDYNEVEQQLNNNEYGENEQGGVSGEILGGGEILPGQPSVPVETGDRAVEGTGQAVAYGDVQDEAPQGEAGGTGSGQLGEAKLVNSSYSVSDKKASNGEYFYQDQSGNIDLVNIPQDIFDAIGYSRAPIRLTPSMLDHFVKRHGKETKVTDEKQAIDFIIDVMNNFDHIRQGKDGALVFSIENGRNKTGRRSISILLSSDSGKFYGVVSSGYEGIQKLKNRPLLWGESAKETSPTNAASANVTTGQSSESGEQSGSASNQSDGQIKLKNGRLLDNATALDESANPSAEQPTNFVGSQSSESKSNINLSNKQAKQTELSENVLSPSDAAVKDSQRIANPLKSVEIVSGIDNWDKTSISHIKAFLESGAKEAKVGRSYYRLLGKNDDGSYKIQKTVDTTRKGVLARDEKGRLIEPKDRNVYEIVAKPVYKTETSSNDSDNYWKWVTDELIIGEKDGNGIIRAFPKHDSLRIELIKNTQNGTQEIRVHTKDNQAETPAKINAILEKEGYSVNTDGSSSGFVSFDNYKDAKRFAAHVDDVERQVHTPNSSYNEANEGNTTGPFGTIYTQFKGKAKEAIEWLKRMGEGEAKAALHHHKIGDISIVWGDAKTGLFKILKKHPEVVDDLQEIIDRMEVVSESENRIKLESETHFAVVSKEFKGEKRDNWLLTAYEKKETSKPANSSMDVDSNLKGKSDDTATRQDQNVSDSKDNLIPDNSKANGQKQGSSYGSKNKIVSNDRYEELKKRMRDKLNQLNVGIDPEMLQIGIEMAVYHIEAGAVKFTDFSKAMITDLGDKIRPYLKSFYNGARDLPEAVDAGLDQSMTPYDEVKRFDIVNFEKPGNTAMDIIEGVAKEQNVEQEAERIKNTADVDMDATRRLMEENEVATPVKEKTKQEKPNKSKKKAVASRKSNERSLFDNESTNDKEEVENGLRPIHELRPEGLPTDGVQPEQGLRGIESETGQGAGQESRGSDIEREGYSPDANRDRSEARLLNQRNNRSERGVDYAPKSVDARIEANIKAIELANELYDSGQQATPDQMAVLRRFSGWGGLGKAFQKDNPTSSKLRELLGDEAYEQANLSRNSAYYTPSYIIDSLWDIARNLGFKGGRVLEGSAGIGNIIGAMPKDMSDRSDIQAVEIDQTTGKILSLLYPDANVEIKGFESTKVENGSVDLAITNVPFVTGQHVIDDTGDKDLSRKFRNIHDFCIAKNVRKLREGGIGIFISSNGTLDNSQKLRNWVVNEGKSDFIGAFRLNKKTFGGTGVTSDIIIIRKRVNGVKSSNAIDVSQSDVERVEEYDTGETRKVKGKEERVIKSLPLDYNKYFMEHPENMAGVMRFGFEEKDTYHPTSKGLYPSKDKDQEQMLEDWVKSFAGMSESIKEIQTENPSSNTYEKLGKDVKEGSMLLNSAGKLCVASFGNAVPLDLNDNKIKGHTKKECFSAYRDVKRALSELMDYEANNEGDEGLNPLLDKLNRAFDRFVKTYGHLHKNTAISFLKNDIDFQGVLALEKYEEKSDENGKRYSSFEKTDVFRKRVIDHYKDPVFSNVKDGIVASIYKNGRIDVPYIASTLGRSEDDVRSEIIGTGLGFEDPISREIEVVYEYLSGNVREKLAKAKEENKDGRYDSNIKALEGKVPMNIPSHLIEFSIGSSWIDSKLYDDFVKEMTGVSVRSINAGGTWELRKQSPVETEKNRAMGVISAICHKTVLGHELIEAAMQNKTITVSETIKISYDGTTETITDKEATQACSNKIDEIRQQFKDWARERMQTDPDMSNKIESIYNEKFNNYVPKSIPEEFIPDYFPGASKVFKMRPHQAKAIIRGTTQPLLLAHEVGTGKTFTMISIAMEMRRLGTAKKPMIVVQNATTGQFVESAKALYPNAKVLSLSDKDHTLSGRQSFYAKIKYNDWDMIVIPQSVFERIPDSEERRMAFVKDKIDEKMAILEQMKKEDENSFIVKAAEREIEQLSDELSSIGAEIENKKKDRDAKKDALIKQNASVMAMEMLDREVDDVENFDDMGIDAILVDEAHEYKHLGFATAMKRGVKGVDPSYSKKAQGVYLKAQSVLERNNGKNVIFATGTPISNTAAEIWTFMRYLMPADVMKEYDIYYFDDFVRNFGNLQQMLEFTTSGNFRENNRFAGYVNLPELVRIWSSVADTVRTEEAEGVKEKIPAMETGKAQDIYLPQTKALRSIMKYVKEELREYDNMSGKEKKANSHIPLTMYGIAKAAAVDVRLVSEDAADDPNSKTNESVRQTLRSLKDSDKYKGTVALFADNYQNKKTGFNLYEDIKKKLVKAGVPADKIVIMRSDMTAKKKLEIFDKVNSGDIRVIMGSTFTLGTGVNIQERLHTLIHIDAPNRPMDYTQRNGRILRQGNIHKDMGIPVRVLRFGVEDSLDVTAYQRLKTKGAIAESIMRGKEMMKNSMENRSLEEDEDVFGDTVAQLSGSEYAMLKSQAEKEVRKLNAKKKQWEADQIYIHNAIPSMEGRIKEAEDRVRLNEDRLSKIKGNDGKIKVNGIIYDSVDGMAEFFKTHNKKQKEDETKIRERGTNEVIKRNLSMNIGGFDFEFTTTLSGEFRRDKGDLRFTVGRKATYSCPELDIDNRYIEGGYIRNGVESIINDVISGEDFREWMENAKASAERMKEELGLLKSRKGKPFQFEKDLNDAIARLEDYTDRMKQELQDKEAKYQKMDGEVEAATGLSEAEEDDVLYREGDDVFTDDLSTDEIISRAKADGTYMKAPNGKPSKLTPRQWAQVRTKAFKDWFGNWEKSARIEKLRNSDSASIKGNEIEITGDYKQNKKNALEYGKSLQGEYTNADTGISVQLQRGRKNGGINEVLQHNYKDVPHILSVAAIPQIIEKSIYISSESNNDTAKNPDVVEYQHFVCGLKIGDEDYTVHSLIAVDKRGDRYYDHNLTNVEKTKLLDRINSQAGFVKGFDATSGTEPTTFYGYKGNKLAKLLQTNSSKVVDENGEPMVVYHSGAQNINAFSRDFDKKGIGRQLWGKGFYFSTSKSKDEWAKRYQSKTGKDAQTYPVFLNIKNPSYSPIKGEITGTDYDGVILQPRKTVDGETDYMFIASNPTQIKSATDNVGTFDVTNPDIRYREGSDISNIESANDNPYEDGTLLRPVTDEETLDRLNNEETIKVYRAMQVIDGKLYPPMSAKVGGKLREPINIDEWEEAEERPELATEDGKFVLNKGNGSSLKAAYNPYIHTSRSPLNDQFSSAQDRDNLVVVEVEIPKSELTSGYKAYKAKDPVGEMTWHSGPVSSKLKGEKARKVILTRWDKPVRIVPDSEVARRIAKLLEGEDIIMPSNVVTPSLRAELEKLGVPFIETDNRGKPILNREGEGSVSDTTYRQRMRDEAENMGRALGVEVEIVDDGSTLPGKKGKAKGFFDRATKKVTVVVGNHKSIGDIQATVLHEVVGHYGLRGLLGERFDDMMDMVYRTIDKATRKRIAEAAVRNYRGDVRIATEEYLASVAERGVDRPGVWSRIKSAIKAFFRSMGIDLRMSDEDIAYLLWKSKNRLMDGDSVPTIIDKVTKDQEMREGLLYRDGLGFGSLLHTPKKDRKGLSDIAHDIMGKIRNGNPFTHENFIRLQEGYQDRLIRLKEFQDKVAKETGHDVKDFEDMYTFENQAHSRAQQDIEDFLKDAMESVWKIHDEIARTINKPAGENIREIETYLMARHGLERNAEMRKREIDALRKSGANPSQDDIDKINAKDFSGLTAISEEITGNPGMDEKACEKYAKDFESKHDTDKLWKAINKATGSTLDKLLETGQITKELYSQIKGMYKYYIPLKEWDGVRATDMYDYVEPDQDIVSNPLKQAKGRKTRAGNVLANIASDYESATMLGYKNLCKLRLLNLARNSGTSELSVSEQWYTKGYDANGNEIWEPASATGFTEDAAHNAQVIQDFNDNMRALQKSGDALLHKDVLRLGVPVKKWQEKQHTVRVKEAGREILIYFNGDPRVAQAINGQNNVKLDNAILRVANRLRKWMMLNYTARNINFILRNFARDFFYVNTMNFVKYGAAFEAKYIANFPKAFAEICAVEFKGRKVPEYESFRKNGGMTGYVEVMGYDRYKNEIERIVKKSEGRNLKVGDFFHAIGSYIECFNSVIENCSRYTVYKTAKQTGMSELKAIEAAKEASVNFNRRGSGQMGAVWAQNAYFFFNASMQGTENFVSAANKNRARAAMALGFWVAFGYTMRMIGAALSGDDDDSYDNLPDYVRQNNIVLYVPGTGNKYIMLPLPVELRAIFGLGDMLGQASLGQYKGRDFAGDLALKLTDLLPKSVEFPDRKRNDDESVVESVAKNLSPDAIRPLLDAYWFNENYFGKRVTGRNAYNRHVPEWQKVSYGTSKTIINASRMMNELTGGDYATKGWSDSMLTNPSALEYLFEQYLGGVGKVLTQSYKSVEGVVNGDLAMRNVPVLSGLTYSTENMIPRNYTNERYRSYIDEYEETASRMRKYKEGMMEGENLSDEFNGFTNSDAFRRYMLIGMFKKQIDGLYDMAKTVGSDSEEAKNLNRYARELKGQMINEIDKLDKNEK